MPRSQLIGFGGLLIALLVLGWLFFTDTTPEPEPAPTPEPTAEAPEPEPEPAVRTEVIGQSVEGRDIVAHSFDSGETDLLLVGGIHGGYEWNSILLAYQAIDYLGQTPAPYPENVTVHVIPNLNPDGLYEATGLTGRFTVADIPDRDIHSAGIGRFNANGVDLNRNFDCKWAPESTWRGQTVSAGDGPFSEPEAAALRDFVQQTNPDAAVFWHSRANNVYGSECENGVLPETLTLMSTYAQAAGYGEVPVFDAYPITGDAEGWLASLGIPAVTVELETRTSPEWERNRAALDATLDQYGK